MTPIERAECFLWVAKSVTSGDRGEAATRLADWVEAGADSELRYRCAEMASELRTGSMSIESFLSIAQTIETFAKAKEKTKVTARPRRAKR